MKIDPKQIAKLITEDVDEYAGLEDADEFGNQCDICGHDDEQQVRAEGGYHECDFCNTKICGNCTMQVVEDSEDRRPGWASRAVARNLANNFDFRGPRLWYIGEANYNPNDVTSDSAIICPDCIERITEEELRSIHPHVDFTRGGKLGGNK